EFLCGGQPVWCRLQAANPETRGIASGCEWEQAVQRQTVELIAKTPGDTAKYTGDLEGNQERLEGMAGATGGQPATSDVTGLNSGAFISMIYLCFQWFDGVIVRQASA